MQRISTTSKATDLYGVGKHGFRNGNLGGGIAPTELEALWCNNLQEEIANVIEASGLALDGNVRNQLLTALSRSGVFGTAPQFDSTTKVATMAAVQRALGNFSYSQSVSGAIALTPAYMGQNVWLQGGAPYTVTLPAVGSVAPGSVLYFWASNPSVTTVARSGADNILVNSTSVTALQLGAGDSLYLVASPTAGVWIAFGGTAQLGLSAAFTTIRAANGYQKLPGGLIWQWGTALTSGSADVAVTFPTAFPTAVTAVGLGPGATGSGVFACQNSLNVAGFSLAGWSSNSSRSGFNCTWQAIGY